MFKRVRVRQNEIDYIAEDVTIRRFTPTPAPPQVPVGEKQADFGEDVTLHYFASKPPATSKAQAVPAAARSVECYLLALVEIAAVTRCIPDRPGARSRKTGRCG